MKTLRVLAGLLLALAAGAAPAAAAGPAPAAGLPAWSTVDDARLLRAATDDGSLMYRRSYDSRGYAPLDQITTRNVGSLRPAFTYKTGLKMGHEAAPVVNGRYMFITTPLDHLIALDATTGAVFWTYERPLTSRGRRTVCCDVVNRGVAVYGDRVFLETLDDHVIAFEAKTGKIAWDREAAPVGVGYAMTSAPLVVGGLVIVGCSAGEYGARGFIAAYDAQTGAERWRTYTIPAAGEPGAQTWGAGSGGARGGGGAWLTGSYDPATKTLFWGVGNPSPWRGAARPGLNLYSDSVLALDPATGKLKWYFQYTPHDEWDYDGVNEVVLADIVRDGKPVHALFHADRNGQFVVLDRDAGTLLYATPLVKATAVTGYRADGTAIVDPQARLTPGTPKPLVCPSAIGGKNWWPTAYDPNLGLAFVPVSHMCMTVEHDDLDETVGNPYLGVDYQLVPEPGSSGFGGVEAIDVATGAKRWGFDTKLPWCDGMLATAGGLVFSGTPQAFVALDERTGATVWSYPTSSGVIGVPVTYRVDGKQYVAVEAGWGGGVAIFGGPAAEATKDVPRGGELYVFAL